jgi:RNA polymerase sigma factor (sigma-70 family)
MTPFFPRRRRQPDPVDRPDPKQPPAAAHGAAPGAGPGAGPGDSPTLHDVRLAQGKEQTDSWHGSWERLSDKIHGYLMRRVGGGKLPYDIEFDDFFSAVMARMLRDLPTLEVRGREEFWAWVKRIAMHQLVDLWRTHKRIKRGGGQTMQQVGDDDVDLIENARDPQPNSVSGMIRLRELESAEAECVDKIEREQWREIYVLRRRWGLSYEEIATRVGSKSADSIRVVFGRVKSRVQDCLRRRLDGYAEMLPPA